MNKQNAKPSDLANAVWKRLKNSKLPDKTPPKKVLVSLFEHLFYTSMNTEEGNLIQVTATLIDPDNPDPFPPFRKAADRWSYTTFDNSIEFSVKNLIKLSQAADPSSSSLAIYYDEKGKLFIWGMIDQAIHYQSFLNFEVESSPEQPGIFQTSIIGIGTLSVMFDYELLAKLNQNILTTNYVDIFKDGPVSEMLKNFSSPSINKILDTLDREFPDKELERDEWESFIHNIWMETLYRILLRLQNYGHGGALLITPYGEKDLDVKFKIDYKRILDSISRLAYHHISNWVYSNDIEPYLEDGGDIPARTYLEESISKFDKNDTLNELKGAIGFISSLTRVDGLVLLNDNLDVKGFGTVTKISNQPSIIYVAKSVKLLKQNLTELEINHFGTRHRSMFSYCWNNPGSLGFVVSQDLDIRAILRVDDKLIMWENIKTQQLIKSDKIKRQVTTIRRK